MSSERLPMGASGTEALVARPWAHLSNSQLLDRLEWSFGENGGFEPEVVWELARRVQVD
ncbi:MAG: hypothetical protein M3144_00855 [Actinomycetota bacterium]|nr:hypothetical protein [Actinomycetota bacterium]